MTAASRIRRLLRDPLGVLRRALGRLRQLPGYDPASYWAGRHRELGFDPRGVARIDGSVEDNERMIREGNERMRALWRREGLAGPGRSLLDVGCGQGHHARNFREEGGTRYTGVDIADVLFEELRREFPGYRFLKLDVSREPLPGLHDVVVMVNVAEHIVRPELFAYAMRNVREHLAPDGAFVVTVPSGPPPERHAPHWAYWSLEAVAAHFPGFTATDPEPFWDKSLVVLRAPGGAAGRPDAL